MIMFLSTSEVVLHCNFLLCFLELINYIESAGKMTKFTGNAYGKINTA